MVTALAKAHGRQPSPEAIFHYVYAVLHAPAYRNKYTQFLRTDFPHIPFTTDKDLFDKLADLGSRLVALHLLESPELDPPACRFDGEGNAMVARTKAQGFRYDPAEQRMYVNRTQYFSPLSAEVYQYRIGGYQVCEKWLKDRKERRLDNSTTSAPIAGWRLPSSAQSKSSNSLMTSTPMWRRNLYKLLIELSEEVVEREFFYASVG